MTSVSPAASLGLASAFASAFASALASALGLSSATAVQGRPTSATPSSAAAARLSLYRCLLCIRLLLGLPQCFAGALEKQAQDAIAGAPGPRAFQPSCPAAPTRVQNPRRGTPRPPGLPPYPACWQRDNPRRW